MTRRALIIPLHWTCVALLLVMVEGGSSHPWVRWASVAAGGLWLVLMLAGGPLGRPSGRLRGLGRAVFLPFHLALYGALAASVVLNALALTGGASDATAFTALLVLLAIAAFHALFHLWRHTALGDGALRMITPRRMHRHL